MSFPFLLQKTKTTTVAEFIPAVTRKPWGHGTPAGPILIMAQPVSPKSRIDLIYSYDFAMNANRCPHARSDDLPAGAAMSAKTDDPMSIPHQSCLGGGRWPLGKGLPRS